MQRGISHPAKSNAPGENSTVPRVRRAEVLMAAPKNPTRRGALSPYVAPTDTSSARTVRPVLSSPITPSPTSGQPPPNTASDNANLSIAPRGAERVRPTAPPRPVPSGPAGRAPERTRPTPPPPGPRLSGEARRRGQVDTVRRDREADIARRAAQDAQRRARRRGGRPPEAVGAPAVRRLGPPDQRPPE